MIPERRPGKRNREKTRQRCGATLVCWGRKGEARLVGGAPINMAAGEGVAEAVRVVSRGWWYVHRDSIAPLRPWAFSTPAGKSGSRPIISSLVLFRAPQGEEGEVYHPCNASSKYLVTRSVNQMAADFRGGLLARFFAYNARARVYSGMENWSD